MAHVEIEFIDEGFIEILNQPALEAVCVKAAKEIAQHAGGTFEGQRWYSHAIGRMRGGRVAGIVSGSPSDDRREAQDRVLSRAVSECRG